MTKQLYRPDEVVAILRISLATFYRLVNTGKLAHVHVGHSIRIHADDLVKYMAGQKEGELTVTSDSI